jgi:hypothetical protein
MKYYEDREASEILDWLEENGTRIYAIDPRAGGESLVWQAEDGTSIADMLRVFQGRE